MVDVINDDLIVISARQHIAVKVIDGGDTTLVTLEGASNELVSLLMPRIAAQKMAIAILEDARH